MVQRVLVVDDDPALSEMVGIVLRAEGYESLFCNNGAAAVQVALTEKPDVILLDLMLPGLDGISVCREIRAASRAPIIMLTARGNSEDVVGGLEAGADDYIVKPFNPSELVARIRTRLRQTGVKEEPVTIGDLVVDPSSHEVRRGTQRIVLTPLEFEILFVLASDPGVVFSREMLLQRIWGYRFREDTRLVNVHVQRLRAKIEPHPEKPSIVRTVRGVGYRAASPN